MLSPSQLKEMLPDPKLVIEELDKYIIGQDSAKRALALMLLNRSLLHLHRKNKIILNAKIEKTNVLLLGPTGTGKTALIKALGEISGIDIAIFDITSVTSAGYIGNKVEDILVRHVECCENYVNNNVVVSDFSNPQSYYVDKQDFIREAVETGIVYIDEIDKIRMRRTSGEIDVNGEMVQNELLKILESGRVNLENARKDKRSKHITEVVTDDILFICGGAFSGLPEIIAKRLNKSSGMGFTSEVRTISKEADDSLLKHVTTQDLIEYGFKPEFVGRMPLKAVLSPVTKDVLMQIITVPKNNVLDQYKELFNVFGIELVLENDALEQIAQLALDLKIGARSVKSIFSNLLLDAMCDLFDYQEEQFVITKELVISKGKGNE